MTRDEAFELLHQHLKNQNLRRHCYAVEAAMRSLAKYLCEKEEIPKEERQGKSCAELVEAWGIAGLIHDADYELTKDYAQKEHTKKVLEWLKKEGVEDEIRNAVARHAWGFVENAPKPKTKMDWALYTCDELTGLIVAVALVKPGKKLASVTVDSVLKKWNSLSFAAGVNRKQIELCESKLRIPLKEFIRIVLEGMQGVSDSLGL